MSELVTKDHGPVNTGQEPRLSIILNKLDHIASVLEENINIAESLFDRFDGPKVKEAKDTVSKEQAPIGYLENLERKVDAAAYLAECLNGNLRKLDVILSV
jgi:hypothetical protein